MFSTLSVLLINVFQKSRILYCLPDFMFKLIFHCYVHNHRKNPERLFSLVFCLISSISFKILFVSAIVFFAIEFKDWHGMESYIVFKVKQCFNILVLPLVSILGLTQSYIYMSVENQIIMQVRVSFWPGLAIKYCKGHPCLVLTQKIHYKKFKMVRAACSF